MKFSTFLLLSFLIVQSSRSQDSTIALSQFEIFTSQANKLLKTEVNEIRGAGFRTITLFKTTDLLSSNSVTAVRLSHVPAADMAELVSPEALYIDYSDLDTIINAINAILIETGKPKHTSDFRLSFITANDIMLSCSYDKDNDYWRFHIGKLYKHLRTIVPGTLYTYTNKKRLAELVELFQLAKSTAMVK